MLKKISTSLILAILSNTVALVFSTLAMLKYDQNSYSDYIFSILLITSGIGLFQYDIGARLAQNITNHIGFGIISVYKSLKINLILVSPYSICIFVYFIYQDLKLSLMILAFSPIFIINQILKNYLSINKKIYINLSIELIQRIICLLIIYILFYEYNKVGSELKFLPYLIFLLQQIFEFIFLTYFFLNIIK